MEPKFQSSFIPKGPIAAGASGVTAARPRGRDLISLLAVSIFTLSVVLAGGIFLYKLYLNYGITKMGENLEAARAALLPETIEELIRLNGRIVSTQDLINRHRILSPVFDFLEVSTPKTVRFTDFNYASTEKGLELAMRGEARGYSALALLADIINQSVYFKNPVFSDLSLDERGNVVFSLHMTVDPSLVSYRRSVENLNLTAPATPPPAATTASTSSPQATTNTN